MRVPSLKVRLGTGTGSGVDMSHSKQGTEEAEHAPFAETLQREAQQAVELNGEAGVASEAGDTPLGNEQRTSEKVRVPSLKVRLGASSAVDMPHSKEGTEEAEQVSFAETLQRKTQQVAELNGKAGEKNGDSNTHDNQSGREQRTSKRARAPSLKLRLRAGSAVDMPHSKRTRGGAEEAEQASVTETLQRKTQKVVELNGEAGVASETSDAQTGLRQRSSERVRVPTLKIRLGTVSAVHIPHSKKGKDRAEEAGHVPCADALQRKTQRVVELNGGDGLENGGSDAQHHQGGDGPRSKPDGDTVTVASAEKNKERGWTVPMKLVLIQLAREFRPFRVADRKATVAEQWTLMHAKVLAEEGRPIGNALAGVSKSRLCSQFNLLLKYKRKSNEEAGLPAHGNSTRAEGQEADLGKAMGDTVNAIHADLLAKMPKEHRRRHVRAFPDMQNDAKTTAEESQNGQVRACPGTQNGRGMPSPGEIMGMPFGSPLRGMRGSGGRKRNHGEDLSENSSQVNRDSDTADPDNEGRDNEDPDYEDRGNGDRDNQDPDNQDSATEDPEADPGVMEMGGGADRKKGKGKPGSKKKKAACMPKATPSLRDLDNEAEEGGLLAFLQESVSQSSIDRRARWEADRDHADKVRRLEREEDRKAKAETKRLEHEAFIARQDAVRLRENDQREQDRLDRKMEYEETWKLEESRRAHELKVLEAQIELARCRSD